jgi:hypothetical protein
MPSHNGHMPSGPSTSDFPPLLRNGTQAIPMQSERAKMNPSGTVWNGAAVKALSHSANGSIGPSCPASPRTSTMAPMPPRTPISAHPISHPVSITPLLQSPSNDFDPDFPRRMPTGRSTGTLYDPSAPRPDSRADSINRVKLASTNVMTPEDVIEAKLAALSVSVGVSIGPPAAKSAPSAPGPAPSYAKIVRRD